jgi:eukaryotic-like serine/threonine-protein kinase
VTQTVLIGQYRLGEPIAAGRLGDVWHCVDESSRRALAVKILRPDLRDDLDFAERLRLGWAREFASIDHPGVVHLYDHGLDPQAGLFVVMEYVDGEPLDRVLQRGGPLPLARALDLVARVADALQAVHERGLAHRELRPGKVLVRADATVVLSLFGLSHQVVANYPWPFSDPGYASPEQLIGQRATYRSDIFSLGMLAYTCLTGRPAFDGDNPLEIAMRVLRESPPALPGDAGALVGRALEKEPESRWPTAAAFAEAARVARRGFSD